MVAQTQTKLIMKLYVAYTTLIDGSGKDVTCELSLEEISQYSELPFNNVKAFSIHKQDNNLVQCVCDALHIEKVQLLYIQLIP